MRVVFMGTPDFAAASLRAILDAGYPVAGVFTQPDRPSGRGMALRVSPVKALATDRGIPVYQPTKLRDGSALAALEALSPDIVAVVAYGRILPDALLAVPPLGCVNVHGSLLPAYRGSAPIQWAVLNGERRTGVSTMYLSHEMDAGDLIFQDETPIGEFETSGELFDRLKEMGAALLVKTLRAIEAGRAPRQPQDHSRASYTRPLDKSMCHRLDAQPQRDRQTHLRPPALAGGHHGAGGEVLPGLRCGVYRYTHGPGTGDRPLRRERGH